MINATAWTAVARAAIMLEASITESFRAWRGRQGRRYC